MTNIDQVHPRSEGEDDNPDEDNDNSRGDEVEGDTKVEEHLDDEINIEASEDIDKEDKPSQEDSITIPGLVDDDADDDDEEDSGDDNIKMEIHPDSYLPPAPRLFSCSNHPQDKMSTPCVPTTLVLPKLGLPHLNLVSRLFPRLLAQTLLEPNSCTGCQEQFLQLSIEAVASQNFLAQTLLEPNSCKLLFEVAASENRRIQ